MIGWLRLASFDCNNYIWLFLYLTNIIKCLFVFCIAVNHLRFHLTNIWRFLFDIFTYGFNQMENQIFISWCFVRALYVLGIMLRYVFISLFCLDIEVWLGPFSAEQEGIKANPIETSQLVDFIKCNKLQTESFIIGANQCKSTHNYSGI